MSGRSRSRKAFTPRLERVNELPDLTENFEIAYRSALERYGSASNEYMNNIRNYIYTNVTRKLVKKQKQDNTNDSNSHTNNTINPLLNKFIEMKRKERNDIRKRYRNMVEPKLLERELRTPRRGGKRRATRRYRKRA